LNKISEIEKYNIENESENEKELKKQKATFGKIPTFYLDANENSENDEEEKRDEVESLDNPEKVNKNNYKYISPFDESDL